MMLSRNEYVVKASMVHRWGRAFFDLLNQGVLPKEVRGDQGDGAVSISDPVADLQKKLADAEAQAKADLAKEAAKNKKLKDDLDKARAGMRSNPTAHEAHQAHQAHMSHGAHARHTGHSAANAQMQLLEKEFHALMASLTRHGGQGMVAAIRHVSADTVRNARVAQHSTVINYRYEYDNRTQFTGPVTVKANDPMKMAAELKKQIAHSRLVSPGRASIDTGVPYGVA